MPEMLDVLGIMDTPVHGETKSGLASYTLHIPKANADKPLSLAVAVQTDVDYKQLPFFASRNSLAVVTLKFAITYCDGFQGSQRYDQALIEALEAVRSKFNNINTSAFLLCGAHDGAQFCLHFSYLHPELLLGVSMVNPELPVAELDPSIPWPRGIENVKELFGHQVNIDALKKVPVHIVLSRNEVGDVHKRVKQLDGLEQSLSNSGVVTRRSIVSTDREVSGSMGKGVVDALFAFFYDTLRIHSR